MTSKLLILSYLLLWFSQRILAAGTPATHIHGHEHDKRQTTSKYCHPGGGLCYVEVSRRTNEPVFRIAIPDASAAPFDALLQVISPVALGWAGFAWGGRMVENPLFVAWPNGNTVTASSRWATDRVVPGVYRTASYKTLSSSKNATHWSIEVVCSGCSKWAKASLYPNEVNTFAWAASKNSVSQPSNNASSFGIHNNVGMFSVDLKTAKVSQAAFKEYTSKT